MKGHLYFGHKKLKRRNGKMKQMEQYGFRICTP